MKAWIAVITVPIPCRVVITCSLQVRAMHGAERLCQPSHIGDADTVSSPRVVRLVGNMAPSCFPSNGYAPTTSVTTVDIKAVLLSTQVIETRWVSGES